MRTPNMWASLLLAGALPLGTLAADILKTNGFSTCSTNSDIQVQKMDIEYNKQTNKVVFDVAGTSAKSQNVTASLTVTAYGKEVYKKDFNPCDQDVFVAQLCPIPAGSFAAQGEQSIPDSYASMIPAIAFNVPDLDGAAKLELKPLGSDEDLACITSVVNNGKTADVPAVKYVAAGIAAAALLLSGISALGSLAGAGAGAGAGGATPSPTFTEVMGWFQSMAMNGMLSVEYPSVYRSFTRNFAFSGGIIPWDTVQEQIDSFRQSTGGNLTEDSVKYLRNATLVYTENMASSSSSSNVTKRALEAFLLARDSSFSVNGTTFGDSGNSTSDQTAAKAMHYVYGIQAFVEQFTIPRSNTFMTVLLVFAIIVAAIAVGILLFKVILETWALFGTFPKSLTGFRKRYWWLLAKTITNLILLVYGVWVLYCVYQFTNGDSWAAKTLAGITLALFTAVLAGFTWKIWSIARKFKKLEGSSEALYEDEKVWRRYSLFYENYKKGYWWIFAPTIVYSFVKGCIIAGGTGHGIVQTSGQLIVESLMLILLLWSRPYSLKSGNWINIVIQVVRVLSVVCILVFVNQLKVSQSTKTITGVILIVMQSVLTGLLAILIAVNAIVICCKKNPHAQRRKDAEKVNRDLDNLTPLDARNSLLMDPTEYRGVAPQTHRANMVSPNPLGSKARGYDPVPMHENPMDRPAFARGNSGEALLSDAANMGGRETPPPMRAPTLPNVDFGHHR